MRAVFILLMLPLAVGCANQSTRKAEPTRTFAPTPAAPAAALAFDTPIAGELPYQMLAREYRSPAAYVGYDETIFTYSYTSTNDRQRLFDDFNHYERQVMSAKVSVSYR